MAGKVQLKFRFHAPDGWLEASGELLAIFLTANQQRFWEVLEEVQKEN